MNNYIIYKVENKENGLLYLGATTKSIYQRKLDHEVRAIRGEETKFQEAITTYGADAFSWEQIDTATSINELAKKEKEYILEYNSKEEGYNADSGGGIKKTVYQYSLEDGSLINSFDCLESAGSVINATKQQLSRACLSVNKIFNGFYWSYEHKVPFEPDKDSRLKEVAQLDLDGDEIDTFKSIAEASEVTGCNKSSIAKVCRGERNIAGGYQWVYQ